MSQENTLFSREFLAIMIATEILKKNIKEYTDGF